MSTITSSDESSHVRRRLLRNAAITLAVAAIVAIGSAKAQSSGGRVSQIKPGTNTSFASLKQIDAGNGHPNRVRGAQGQPFLFRRDPNGFRLTALGDVGTPTVAGITAHASDHPTTDHEDPRTPACFLRHNQIVEHAHVRRRQFERGTVPP